MGRLNGLVFILITLGGIYDTQAVASDPQQQAIRRVVQVPVSLNYVISLPPGYESKDSWPLLLFLHGAGERGDDLSLVTRHGPPKLIAAGQPFPFVVVSPQCAKDRWWQPVELSALLDDVETNYRIDKDRIYVTGLSMGGFGAWELAAYSPERFAAIVPICGGGETFWTKRMKHLPVWVFHGAEDEGVPLERSQKMVEEMRKHGGQVRLTVYPHTAHFSWVSAYNNPELYGWLLQQRRQPVAPTP